MLPYVTFSEARTSIDTLKPQHESHQASRTSRCDLKHLKLNSNCFPQNRGNRHSLVIRNVTYMDLGNYTCQASNNLGKDRGSLTLSGIPTVCYFDSVSKRKLSFPCEHACSEIWRNVLFSFRNWKQIFAENNERLPRPIQHHMERAESFANSGISTVLSEVNYQVLHAEPSNTAASR